MPIRQQTNLMDCGISVMNFLTFILFDEDPKTQRFEEKLVRESLLQMSAEQHMRRFPNKKNNVEKCKCKSILLESCYSCCQPVFQKIVMLRIVKGLNVVCVGNYSTQCSKVSLKKVLKMKVLNETARVVHPSGMTLQSQNIQ